MFPLDDLGGFEHRLQSRQLVAESVSALIPENVLSMEDDLDRLQAAYESDSTLLQFIAYALQWPKTHSHRYVP